MEKKIQTQKMRQEASGHRREKGKQLKKEKSVEAGGKGILRHDSREIPHLSLRYLPASKGASRLQLHLNLFQMKCVCLPASPAA